MTKRKTRPSAWLPMIAVAAIAAILSSQAQAQTTIPVKIYAQELVDRTVAQHPDLRTIAIYATPPKTNTSLVLASNIGLIGTPAGSEDAGVAASGKTRVVESANQRLEIELPLHDLAGLTVGTLALTWANPGTGGRAALEKKSADIRDGLSHRILNTANLLDPYPYVATATTRSRAQTLIEDTVRRHPEVTVLALRLKVPPKNDLVVVGSTFGRHGKPADNDDLKVLDSPAPIPGLYSNDKRFGVDLPVKDAKGGAIGTMNVGYAYSGSEDKKALEAKAVALCDEIQTRLAAIPAPEEIDP
ncbi:MAG: hypothetical protein QM741_07245 [Rudaea sp.]|uniref:hypothetical protein n=1 Tax=Rudaea sp. TaxID=2136325 RepID=UPI0039E25591